MARAAKAAVIMVAAIMAMTNAPAAILAMEFTGADLASENATWALYHRWSARYSVERVASDKARRFAIFRNNAWRAGLNLSSGHVGINVFGDLTDDEVAEVYNCAVDPQRRPVLDDDDATRNNHSFVIFTPVAAVAWTNLPYGVDWTERGLDGSPSAVSNVKDQGPDCGSCWAFAAAAAVEGIHAIKTKTLAISLSEQQIIDCDTSSHGCNDGWGRSALTYVKRNGGLAPESAYPYKGRQISCQKVISPLIPIDGYIEVPSYSELELRAAVAHQPVVVTVDAKGDAFKRYDGGVFRGPCDNNGGGHQMTAVGYSYNLDTHETYWILKNSWGESWGEKGYMRMLREINSTGPGLCGIHKSAFYPWRRD